MSSSHWSPWVVAVVFFALAGVMLATGRSPSHQAPETDPEAIGRIGPPVLRTPMTDPPTTKIGPYEQDCSACHGIFEAKEKTADQLLQHDELVVDHGINSRCRNCHSLGNHDKLVLRDGREIGYADVVQLCAQCHGPTFRDWEKGIHGKTLGSWEVGSEDFRRLICTECHDPHKPAFLPFEPLPRPQALRTHPSSPASDGAAADSHEVQNPLQKWDREGAQQ